MCSFAVSLWELSKQFGGGLLVSIKATFHLTISMLRQRATGKFKGIITITGVAGLLYQVKRHRCLHAGEALECQKSLSYVQKIVGGGGGIRTPLRTGRVKKDFNNWADDVF